MVRHGRWSPTGPHRAAQSTAGSSWYGRMVGREVRVCESGMPKVVLRTLGLGLHGLIALALAASVATAQQSAPQIVENLNRDAMEAYNALDINKAGAMLE